MKEMWETAFLSRETSYIEVYSHEPIFNIQDTKALGFLLSLAALPKRSPRFVSSLVISQ